MKMMFNEAMYVLNKGSHLTSRFSNGGVHAMAMISR